MGITQNNLKPLRQMWRKYKVRKPAVFLDRDGTIIRFKEEVALPSEVHLLRGAGTALRTLGDSGYLLIVVTNQPMVEKGVITVAQAKKINERLRNLLAKTGAKLDAVYTCPHRFGSDCTCRKPDIGLIKQAQKDFSIDMKKSWYIGDTTRDMETGRRAKLKTILVKTGDGGKDKRFYKTKGNYRVKDLLAAARTARKVKAAR